MNLSSRHPRRTIALVTLLIAALLIAACGDTPQPTATQPAAQATSTTAPPAATATTVPRPTNTSAPPTNTVAPTRTAAPTRTVAAANDLTMKTYSSDALEFKIKYPGDWEVQEVASQTAPETDGQVYFLRPGSNGNTGIVVISNKAETPLTSEEILRAVADTIVNNTAYSNVTEDATTLQLGNAEVGASHLEYDWQNLHMIVDLAALGYGNRAYSVFSIAPRGDYDANIVNFQLSFTSFEPTAQVTNIADTDVETYVTGNGGLSILKPKTWSADSSDPAGTIFASPDGDGIIIISTEKQAKVLTSTELNTYIDNFMASSFTSNEGYVLNSTEPQPDGSIRVSFNVQGPNSEPWRGNGFFEQRDTVVIVSLFTADEDSWEKYGELYDAIANSITIDATKFAGPTPVAVAATPFETQQFDDPAATFSTLEPVGWTRSLNADGTIASWISPGGDAILLIQATDAGDLPTDYFSNEQNAIDFVTAQFGEEPEFTIAKTSLQSDGSMSVSWTMIGANGRPWQGQGFFEIRQSGGNWLVAQVVTADSEVWETYKPGFNDILNSLKLK